MAIDQTAVALNLCTKISRSATIILTEMDNLESYAEQINKANINLSSYDAQIAVGDGIKQATGQTYQVVASEVKAEMLRALKAFTSVSGGIQGWAALQRVRA